MPRPVQAGQAPTVFGIGPREVASLNLGNHRCRAWSLVSSGPTFLVTGEGWPRNVACGGSGGDRGPFV